MIILIDESGIHSPVGHSTVALVYVEVDNMVKLTEQITRAESAMGIQGFHWAHRNWKMREQFISRLGQMNFRVKLAVFANPIKIEPSMAAALKQLITEQQVDQIFIDGRKSNRYARRLKKVLRSKGVWVNKLRMANDQAMPALRLADAMAGLSRYNCDQPGHIRAAKLYKQIEPKIDLIVQI